jgi:phenylacetate-CoA ligase
MGGAASRPEGAGLSLASAIRNRVRLIMAALTGESDRYRALAEAMSFSRLSPEEVAREQLARLREILIHAGETVPYWRDLFAAHGFQPDGVERVDDLSRLPVLTKEIIRREGERMLSERFDKRRLLERKTGGSTGEPLRFFAAPEEYEVQMGLHLRSMALVGVRPGDREVKFWGYGRPQFWGNRLAPLTGRKYFDAYRLSPDVLDRHLSEIRRFRPRAMYGYTGALHQLARHAAERRLDIPGLEFLFTTAEKLFPEQRREMESALGARVIDLYGSHEFPRLASECLRGNMHSAPDAAVFEFVLDERESERPPGADPSSTAHVAGDASPPRLLLTSLHARAMPLIRYEIGDTVRPVYGACPCGLPFPLIEMEIGKVHHVFELTGGRRVHTGMFYRPVFRLEVIRAFQIRHLEPGRIEYVCVAREGLADEAERAMTAVCHRLGSDLGGDVTISCRFVDDIPATGRGKRPIVVSQVEEDDG